MNLERRIEAFKNLGKYINAIDEVTLNDLCTAARNENSWFTPESVRHAFRGVSHFLDEYNLRLWLSKYSLHSTVKKVVGVVMAGNIPLVGFHDLLCILISGHKIQMKLSSKDTVLMKFVTEALVRIEPSIKNEIAIVEQLKNFDAVIATGSDNSGRYFNYYFSKYPNIIRKNRSSCAILTGFESDEELRELGNDVFSYFGLGCRNVSKVYVPKEFDFSKLLKNWQVYDKVMLHHKYHNNYDYQKSILLVNREEFFDSGFIILQESEKLVSPISVLYYEFYDEWTSLIEKLNQHREKIQVIVGNVEQAHVRIGQSQYPAVWDYADQVDTLKFLESLS
jgi:hypothetical protein